MKKFTFQLTFMLLGLVSMYCSTQAQGVRRSSFRVNSPATLQGYKIIDEADSLSTNTSPWGTSVDSSWENYQVAYDPDNLDGCAAFGANYFAGKFALINRGGCEFGSKALRAQQAGAVGVIIVNNLLGVVGMGAGADGASVEIPVIMVTTADGSAMRNQIAAGTPVDISLTAWRYDPTINPIDVGFMNDGPTLPIGRTIPHHQVVTTASTNDINFRVYTGGRTYNFSTLTWDTMFQKGVLSYKPSFTSGTYTLKDSNSVNWNFSTPVTTTDSIISVIIDTLSGSLVGFNMDDEQLGKYKMVNSISVVPNTEIGNSLLNNTWTYEYAIHDSIYSKSEYDFTNNGPVVNSYINTSTPVEWGPVLYIRNGGYGAQKAQVVVMRGIIDDSVFNGQQVIVTLSKWSDNDGNGAIDYNTELDEVATGDYTMTATDIIPIGGKIVTMNLVNSLNPGSPIVLEADTKYWLHVINLGNATGTHNFALGADYYSDYSANLLFGKSEGNPLYSNNTMFGGGFANAGAPAMALHMSKNLAPNAVNDIKSINGTVKVYPNPATEKVNISVTLNKLANNVTYQVMDITGNVISTATHRNIQTELYSYNTSKLAAGTYFVKVTTDEGSKEIKFTVTGE